MSKWSVSSGDHGKLTDVHLHRFRDTWLRGLWKRNGQHRLAFAARYLLERNLRLLPGARLRDLKGGHFQSVDMTTILKTKSVPDQVLLNVMSIPRIHRLP